MTDSEILDLYWNRDEEALRQTEAAYGGRLQRLSNGILHDLSDAQECVNDTYLQAWNTIPPKRPDYFFAYLAKICRYISLGRLDWNNASKRKAQVVSLTAEMEQCIPDCRTGQTLEAGELGELLTSFLKTLSMDARKIFLRRYFHMESVSEIANALGCTESKVKAVLFRTRNKLYDYLQKEGMRL